MAVPNLLALLRFFANFGEDSASYQVEGLLQHIEDAHLKAWFYMSNTCPQKLQTLLLFPYMRKK